MGNCWLEDVPARLGGSRCACPSRSPSAADRPSLINSRRHTDPRARFTAIFDSHRLRPETSDKQELASSGTDHDPPDEGSFSTLPNGDVLERGEMRRPETGDITPYEERWRRLPLTRDEDAPVPAVMLESTDAGDKAFLGRVGDFEVAIAQRGEQIQARVGRLHGTTWETSMATVDGAGLPDLSVLDLTAMDGGGVELAGRRWKVIEQSS